MLVTGGGLDRGDDLPGHAQLGERTERGLLVRTEIADCLVQADQPLLDQVVVSAADQKVRARLQAHEGRVAPDQAVERHGASVARLENELKILKFALSFLR